MDGGRWTVDGGRWTVDGGRISRPPSTVHRPGELVPGTLLNIYAALREHFGALCGPEARNPWWPLFSNQPAFEMLVGAVLVQQTRWETVEAAILRLQNANLLSPPALAAADPAALAALIRPAAFHSQKAPGLVAIAGYICAHYGGDLPTMLARPTAALRPELLSLPRIGPETADVILLYAGNHPVFVIDDYTRRLFARVAPADGGRRTEDGGRRTEDGGIDWRRARYETVRAIIEQRLAEEAHSFEGATVPRLSSTVSQATVPRPSSTVPQATVPRLSSTVPQATVPRPSSTVPQATVPRPSSTVQIYADYHAQINEVCVRYCLTKPRCDGPPARRVYSRQNGRDSYLDRDEGCPLRKYCAYYQAGRKGDH